PAPRLPYTTLFRPPRSRRSAAPHGGARSPDEREPEHGSRGHRPRRPGGAAGRDRRRTGRRALLDAPRRAAPDRPGAAHRRADRLDRLARAAGGQGVPALEPGPEPGLRREP